MTRDQAVADFGRGRLKYWPLDPDAVFLNNGSFGATPKAVLTAQSRWRHRLEHQPVRFMTETLEEALAKARGAVAAFLHADPEGLAFVANATEAVNSVLRSLRLGPSDLVVVTDQAYPGVNNAVKHAVSQSGARLKRIRLPVPLESTDQACDIIRAELPERATLAVFDHVVSGTGAVLPVDRISSECRSRGIPVLIDGAHAPGMLPLNLGTLKVDWYAANLHKWCYAPKGCGILWTSGDHRSDTHPAVISTQYGGGYTAEFDWMGTRDPTPWLTAPSFLKFYNRMGGAKARDYMTRLADHAGDALSASLDSRRACSAEITGSLASVRLPKRFGTTAEEAKALNHRLWYTHKIEVPIFPVQDALWLRVSAQVFNEPSDIERLASALSHIPQG